MIDLPLCDSVLAIKTVLIIRYVLIGKSLPNYRWIRYYFFQSYSAAVTSKLLEILLLMIGTDNFISKIATYYRV